ncbi:MAG: tetratricopeptide repeat protein [Arcobacter sp.]|nr:tetratricopeptide repeat protein [Arcobacter sp.]
MNTKMEYNPRIFETKTIDDAKRIILTPECGMDTNERWEKETNFLSQDICAFLKDLDKNSVVVDYGCGIGRVSRELIQKIGCKVIGVDISASMRDMAKEYVNNTNFEAISPALFRERILDGLKVDGIISIWVLQHSLDPISDVALLKASLKLDGLFYVLNNKISAVPTNKGWINNGVNIFALLEFNFSNMETSQLPQEVAKDKLHSETFIVKLKNNKPKTISPDYITMLRNASSAYSKKEYETAKNLYAEAYKKYPIYSDALNGLGVIDRSLGDTKGAINLYIKAIKLDPLNGFIYNNLSNAFKSAGKINEAIKASYDAIRCDRTNGEFYNNIGLLFERVNDTNQAIEAYKSAVRVNPKNTKAINNLGVLLYNQKRYDESAKVFQVALNVDPDYVEVYSNMGAALNKAKKYDESIKSLQTAILKMPKHSGAYTNLGNVYNKLHNYKEAAKQHELSIKLDPLGYNAYSNVGTSYKNLGLKEKAVESYKKAIELKPDFENAHFDLATVYLSKKDFKNGFSEYEWRFKKDEMKGHILKHKEIFSKKRFDGIENIEGKTLLLHTEQGFGDSIMFGKFVDLVKEKYKCHVILQCRDELKTLFLNSFKNIDHFYGRDKEVLPSFDFHYPMLSLPYLFEVKDVKDIPTLNPYLIPANEEDLDIKKEKSKLNIGICWSASVTGESYDGKVFDVEYFRPIIENPKFNVYTLQVGVENEELKKAGLDSKVIDLTSKLTDFNKTAYLIKQLDFVISSDTSVAHLCGAINKEVWVPLQKVPDWRWETVGDKSYWYPSAKLFRQKTARVWDGVFQSIYDKINKQYKVKLKTK